MQKYLGFIKKFTRLFRKDEDDSRGLMEKLRDKYRLVIMNDETFEEVSSLKLTPLSVYVFLSSLIVGTAILVVVLVIYTPLKRYIPGYGDFQRDEEIALLTGKVADLEKEIEATRAYNENFRKILVGDLEGLDEKTVREKSKLEDTGATPPATSSEPSTEAMKTSGNATAPAKVATATAPATIGLGTILTQDKPLEQIFFMPPVSGEVM
ncbi:MAG: hypothetical protein EP344_12805, partial [Bacteroidetes bacterium]